MIHATSHFQHIIEPQKIHNITSRTSMIQLKVQQLKQLSIKTLESETTCRKFVQRMNRGMCLRSSSPWPETSDTVCLLPS